jgi:hypothetical protein
MTARMTATTTAMSMRTALGELLKIVKTSARRRIGRVVSRRRARLAAVAGAWLFLLLAAGPADAHLNSPDLVHEGMAGPYRLLVTIRPPEVIPGVALIEVLASRADLRAVTLVPLPLGGPGAATAPLADLAERSADGSLFTGKLWLMATGSWQVRVHAEGPAGGGDLSVPVPALALRTKAMRPVLGAVLLILLAFLFAGLVSIVGASLRDADLPPGAAPDARRRRRARTAEIVAALVLAAAVAAGKSWWGSEDTFYRGWIYKPLALAATIDAGASAPGVARAPALSLTLSDPGWIPSRHLDDLLPDHGHLMHLFVVKLPGLELMAHLHPDQVAPGRFTQRLPRLTPGQYQLFADIVHRTGLGETATTMLTVPSSDGSPTSGDDALGAGAPIPAVAAPGAAGAVSATLADGTRVVWLRDAQPLRPGRPTWFRFRVESADGSPARDLVPYMGMAGHALFLKHDRTVFAHIHPSGSVPMAALGLTAPGGGADPHAGHMMHAASLPPEIAFPYAPPRTGDYRLYVQFKRADTIETAIFDARVE